MKKFLLFTLTAAFFLMIVSGCANQKETSAQVSELLEQLQSEESSSDNSDASSESIWESSTDTNTESMENSESSRAVQVKVSDLFQSEEPRIWYLVSSPSNVSAGLSYDDTVDAVYVARNGKVDCYSGGDSGINSLEYLDTLSDNDFFPWLEMRALQEEEEQNRYAYNEHFLFPAGIFQDEVVSFEYKPDKTGNQLESEIINLPHKTFGFEVEEILKPTTILSKEFIGFYESGNIEYYLITENDFDPPIQIVLNDAQDEVMEQW